MLMLWLPSREIESDPGALPMSVKVAFACPDRKSCDALWKAEGVRLCVEDPLVQRESRLGREH